MPIQKGKRKENGSGEGDPLILEDDLYLVQNPKRTEWASGREKEKPPGGGNFGKKSSSESRRTKR
jgi:hypothetical protein